MGYHFFSTLSLFIGLAGVLILSSCNEKNHNSNDPFTTRLSYYPSGKIMENRKYQNGRLTKVYYLAEEGTIDSIESYDRNHQISTIKFRYYSDEVHVDKYFEDNLVEHLVFDTSGRLLLQAPCEIPVEGHSSYKFQSGRTYFDKAKIDTIQILNNDIPPYNLSYTVIGAYFGVVKGNKGEFKFKIKPSAKKYSSKDSLVIYIGGARDINDTINQRTLFDSLKIPVR